MLQLVLGLPHCVLLPHNGDELLILVFGGGEDDACAGAVPDFADVGASSPDQELVVLWFGMQLCRVVVDLLEERLRVKRPCTRNGKPSSSTQDALPGCKPK